jgi:hypothetical protein
MPAKGGICASRSRSPSTVRIPHQAIVKKRPQCGPRGERPKQALPVEIVSDLLTAIRNQFYPDSLAPQSSILNHQSSIRAATGWHADQHFIKREFCLYLASWLDKRGVTLKPDRYKALLLGLLNEIKTHGNTAAVKYWPGYLKHVLQQHLKHHGEDIYHEAKSLRTIAENSLLALGTLNESRTAGPGCGTAVDPIRVMAEARRDLLQNKRSKRPSKTPEKQLDLL